MTELALVLAMLVCAFASGGAIGWYLRDLEDDQP